LEFGAKQQNLAEIFPKPCQNHQKLLKMHSNSKQNSKILQKSFENLAKKFTKSIQIQSKTAKSCRNLSKILPKSPKTSQNAFKFKAKQ